MSEQTNTPENPENSPEGSSNFDFDQFIREAEGKIETLKKRRATISERKDNFESAKGKVDPETLKDIEISQEIESDLEKIEYKSENK